MAEGDVALRGQSRADVREIFHLGLPRGGEEERDPPLRIWLRDGRKDHSLQVQVCADEDKAAKGEEKRGAAATDETMVRLRGDVSSVRG